jgi:hypothetical protein
MNNQANIAERRFGFAIDVLLETRGKVASHVNP